MPSCVVLSIAGTSLVRPLCSRRSSAVVDADHRVAPMHCGRVCLVSGFTDNYEIGYFCSERTRHYASLHGYEFRCRVGTKWDLVHEILYASCESSFSWCKIPCLLEVLREQKHAWVVWIDADAMVVNDSVRLEDVLEELGVQEEHQLIFAKDLTPTCRINAGVFLIRNTEFMCTFFESLWDRARARGASFLSKRHHEQSLLEKMLKVEESELFSCTAEEWALPGTRVGRFTLVCDNRYFNNNKSPCDWIFHAACSQRPKLGVLAEVLDSLGNLKGGRPDWEALWKVHPLRSKGFAASRDWKLLRSSEFPFLDLYAARLTAAEAEEIVGLVRHSRIAHLDLSLNPCINILRVLESCTSVKQIDAFKCVLSGDDLKEIANLFLRDRLRNLKLLDLYGSLDPNQVNQFRLYLGDRFSRILDTVLLHPFLSCRCESPSQPLILSDGNTMVVL